jgi:hypothetical protein
LTVRNGAIFAEYLRYNHGRRRRYFTEGCTYRA